MVHRKPVGNRVWLTDIIRNDAKGMDYKGRPCNMGVKLPSNLLTERYAFNHSNKLDLDLGLLNNGVTTELFQQNK